MSIGQTIKLYRREKGLTQSELAELIGVSMQAVSKWETNAGMPDIAQIVPLARVLEISTDKLLGNVAEEVENQVTKIKAQFPDINIISGVERAKRFYAEASGLFNKHPGMSDIALICLESFTELVFQKEIVKESSEIIEECERYMHCILRYEKDADRICRAYCIMARAYNLQGEEIKSKEVLGNIPQIYGDRNYWDAENAYLDGNYELALQKVKESFALKARFISRCIRLAIRSISKSGREGSARECYELSEYMSRIVSAFLSGGDYLPSRQIMQKCCNICGLVEQSIEMGENEKSKQYFEELLDVKEQYAKFLENPSDKHCLMFVEGDFDNAEWFNMTELEKMVDSVRSKIEEVQ